MTQVTGSISHCSPGPVHLLFKWNNHCVLQRTNCGETLDDWSRTIGISRAIFWSVYGIYLPAAAWIYISILKRIDYLNSQ